MKRTNFHPSTLILLPLIFVILSFAGPSHSLPGRSLHRIGNDTDSLVDELQKVAMHVKEAFIRGDSSLYLKTYTPDACLLAPNAPSLCGQQGLIRFYNNSRRVGIRDAVFTSVGLYGPTGEYVTEQGVFEVFDATGNSLNKGKVINIWKKTNDGWRIFRQMMNFDAPMPQPPASSPK
jgi:ketosteroid isomerase-like protein